MFSGKIDIANFIEQTEKVEIGKEGIIMLRDERFNRFKHNLSLEYAMWDLFGPKHYGGMAGGFRDASYCREVLLKAVRRIRNRFSEIPMDERLTQNVGSILDSLEANAKKISEDRNTDWNIITDFLHLVIHLIGYDLLDGKVHRNVIFFQNLGQEQEDWKWQIGDREYYDHLRLEEKRRYMLVNQLMKNNVPKYQIAKLLGLSIKRVNQIMLESRKIEMENGKTIPKFE